MAKAARFFKFGLGTLLLAGLCAFAPVRSAAALFKRVDVLQIVGRHTFPSLHRQGAEVGIVPVCVETSLLS
jgi:hypothetical protein